jgi:hypothetical protein
MPLQSDSSVYEIQLMVFGIEICIFYSDGVSKFPDSDAFEHSQISDLLHHELSIYDSFLFFLIWLDAPYKMHVATQ